MINTRTICLLVITVFCMLLAGCDTAPTQEEVNKAQTVQKQVEPKKPASYYMEKINNADTIKIEERTISMGKQFEVFVDKEKVATIKGKTIKMLSGETLTMTDGAGNFILKEEEEKRWIPFKDRCGTIKSHDNTVVGYIGDERIADLFNVGWKFHFYNIDKKEVGVSEQVNLLNPFKHNKVHNSKGEEVYNVEADFSFSGSDYTLHVLKKNDTDIPVTNELFMICIEDAIHQKEKSKD